MKHAIIIVLSFLIVFSCKEMDDTYRQFVENGETIYVGKADSMLVRGGNKRAEISWLLLSDPKVTNYKVFWNNRKDSITGRFIKTENIDTIRVMISPLDENKYEFETYLYDDEGNSSVSSSVLGAVYGERYINSLISRSYIDLQRINGGDDLEISWGVSEENSLFSVIHYWDMDNKEKVKNVSKSSKKDTLYKFSGDKEFQIKTAFIPDSLALDTFFSSVHTSPIVPLIPVEIDKSLWKDADLADDFNFPEHSYWPIENLWREVPGSNSIFFTDPKIPGISLPSWLTIDLGDSYTLNRLRVNQISHTNSWIFSKCSPRIFEIWASEEATTDWSKWDLLVEGESVKPSGLPDGVLTSEDRAVNAAGEDFEFLTTGKSYRYVRFKTIQTWGGDLNLCLRELTLWGNKSK